MGFGRYALFSSINANIEKAVFAAQGQIASLKTGEVKENSFVVFFQLGDHSSVHLVVKDITHGVRTDRMLKHSALAVQQVPYSSECFHTDNFSVGQFHLAHVDTLERSFELSDPTKFLLPTFLEERVVKFRSDPVYQATTDG